MVYIFEYGNNKEISRAKAFPGDLKADSMIPFAHRLIQKARENQGLMEYQIMFELTTQSIYNDNCIDTTVCILAFLPHILDSNA